MEGLLPVSLGAGRGGHEGAVAGCTRDHGGPATRLGADKGGLEGSEEGGRRAGGCPGHQFEGALLKDGCSRHPAAAHGELSCVYSHIHNCRAAVALAHRVGHAVASCCTFTGVSVAESAGRSPPAVLPGGGMAKGLHPQVGTVTVSMPCCGWWLAGMA